MINCKKDLKEYLHADLIALHRKKFCGIIGKYLYYLRKTEYHNNTHHKIRGRIFSSLLKVCSVISGRSSPPNTFGKGLALYHYGTIIVNPSARFGDFCCIQAGVNVSENVSGGNYVYLAPGAKVNAHLKIADYVIIASNAVLTKNVEESNVTWAGVPAKKISNKGWHPSHEIIAEVNDSPYMEK